MKNKNPYLTIDACVERLYREYQKYGKLIVAVDHDSTVAPFHPEEMEFDYSDTIDAVKRCRELGFHIVIFTGTAKENWPQIHNYWTETLKISYDQINKNAFPMPIGNDGKIYYNILLDDRAGLSASLEILLRLLEKIEFKKFYDEAERV
jgi:hypothetical protein